MPVQTVRKVLVRAEARSNKKGEAVSRQKRWKTFEGRREPVVKTGVGPDTREGRRPFGGSLAGTQAFSRLYTVWEPLVLTAALSADAHKPEAGIFASRSRKQTEKNCPYST